MRVTLNHIVCKHNPAPYELRGGNRFWRRLTRFASAAALTALLACAPRAAAGEGGESPEPGERMPVGPAATVKPPSDTLAFAAEVDMGKVTQEQVFEVWGPAWYNALAEYRSGSLSPAECDRKLQKSWDEALETVIKDELFYQEAMRSRENAFQRAVDNAVDQQGRDRRPGQPMPNRSGIENRFRSSIDKQEEKILDELIQRRIKASGGIVALKRVLAARGITWQQWVERIRRKLLIDTHLYGVLRPTMSQISPGEVREYYKNHQGEFTEPGRVEFRHILFSFDARGGEDAARSAAASVYEAIREGRLTFEEAAAKHSDDLRSKAGGGLETGIASEEEREVWLENLREAVRKEKPGALGPILISPIGCHLVMLVKTYPDVPMPWAKAQEMIQNSIMRERMNAARDKYYRELRDKVNVKILIPTFPQSLSCTAISANKHLIPVHHVGPEAIPEAYRESNEAAPAPPAQPPGDAKAEPDPAKAAPAVSVALYVRTPGKQVYLSREVRGWQKILCADAPGATATVYELPSGAELESLKKAAAAVSQKLAPGTYRAAGLGESILLLKLPHGEAEREYTLHSGGEGEAAPADLLELVRTLMLIGRVGE